MPILSMLQAAGSILRSRLGRFALATSLAFVLGYHHAAKTCAAREASARAAVQHAQDEERARERDAAETLARDATQRAGDDALAVRAMQAKIHELQSREKIHAPTPHSAKGVASRSCRVDRDFQRVLREFDAAGSR